MTVIQHAGFGSYNPVQAHGSYASASAARIDAAYSRSSDIVINTLEGDKVTISSSHFQAGGYETYEAIAMGKGASVYKYGESAYFESSRQMQISVTGDLNDEELEDIDHILSTLDEMMTDLVAGNLEKALSKSTRFMGMDAIASFAADMNVTASIAISSYETAAFSTSSPMVDGGEANALERIDRAADTISNRLNARTASLENLVSKLDDFFTDWFDDSTPKPKDQGKGIKWASRFANRLMNGLEPEGHQHQVS